MRNGFGWMFVGLVCLVGDGSAAYVHASDEPEVSRHGEYRIDAKQSRFVVATETTWLSPIFAHDHALEVRDYAGVIVFVPGNLEKASLQMIIRADSLHLLNETSMAQRQSVETALREEVLETSKYPEISFKSSSVVAKRLDDGTYDARIAGELCLHGVRRQVAIPARVAVKRTTLRAIGVLELRQTDFKITPFSFVNGSVVIKDTVTLAFDIVAVRR